MRTTVIRIMTLALMRDRAALAMVFVLPGVVFVIFAAIFSGATGAGLKVKVAIADDIETADSRRLVARILADGRLVRVGNQNDTGARVRALVLDGSADAGVVLVRGARALDQPQAEGAAPIEIVSDPTREISVAILDGIVQRAWADTFPDVPVRAAAALIDTRLAPFTPEQRARVAAGIDAMHTATTDVAQPSITVRSSATARPDGPSTPVTYYAGAVAIMFLLFSALDGALTFLEERESGLLDRLATSPGGARVLIDGKFIFLVLRGVLQAGVIYAVAWGLFAVDLPGHAGAWLLITVAGAVAAAGLALAFVTLCRTRQQATTLGQMLVLVVSAVGGSMVPRYLMPPQFQALGWATPNTWALEAYTNLFQRGDSGAGLIMPSVVLAGSGLLGLLVARWMADRRV